jgi:hypothetical protein
MIHESMIPAVSNAFPEVQFIYSLPPEPIIRLASPNKSIGDLVIYDHGVEATVAFPKFSDMHLTPLNEDSTRKEISQSEIDEYTSTKVVGFLNALFSDRVLFAANEDSAGFSMFYEGENPDNGAFQKGDEHFLWSGADPVALYGPFKYY